MTTAISSFLWPRPLSAHTLHDKPSHCYVCRIPRSCSLGKMSGFRGDQLRRQRHHAIRQFFRYPGQSWRRVRQYDLPVQENTFLRRKLRYIFSFSTSACTRRTLRSLCYMESLSKTTSGKTTNGANVSRKCRCGATTTPASPSSCYTLQTTIVLGSSGFCCSWLIPSTSRWASRLGWVAYNSLRISFTTRSMIGS